MCYICFWGRTTSWVCQNWQATGIFRVLFEALTSLLTNTLDVFSKTAILYLWNNQDLYIYSMCFANFDIICCHTFNQMYFWLLLCSSVSNKCTANCHMKHQVCRLQPWSHLPVQGFHINSRVLTLQLKLLMFCLRHSKPQIAHAGKYNCKESLCSAVTCRNQRGKETRFEIRSLHC